jgi:hypothetical protein
MFVDEPRDTQNIYGAKTIAEAAANHAVDTFVPWG